MNRTTLLASTAALVVIGLGMVLVRTVGASPPAPTSGAGPAAVTGGSVMPALGMVPGVAAAAATPFAVAAGSPFGWAASQKWGATVMTGGTVVGSPGVPAAAPALVMPPAGTSPAAFGPVAPPAPNGAPFAGATGTAPPSPDGTSTLDVATEVGPGPTLTQAPGVGPENGMATRAQRVAIANGTAPPDAPPPGAPPADNTTKDPLAGWGPPPAPLIDPRRFTEAHWQGLEVVPKTPLLAKALQLPPGVQGVVVDDVTLPADLQGFVAGDLVTHVGQLPTPNLTSFIRATELMRERRTAQLDILRNQKPMTTTLTALMVRLGTANGETPSMIPPGARMPHEFRGPCTNCHRIGTTGTLAVDQGDLMVTTAPTIRVGARRPHRDRGPCLACHKVTP